MSGRLLRRLGAREKDIATHLQTGKFYLDTPFTIPDECMHDFQVQTDLLARGAYGLVYNVNKVSKELESEQADPLEVNREPNLYVLKLIVLDVPIPDSDCVANIPDSHFVCLEYAEDRFAKEVAMTQLAADIGIGPKFYAAWICEIESPLHEKYFNAEDGRINAGFIVIEKMDITLSHYIDTTAGKNNLDTILDQLKTLITIATEHGLALLDAHQSNIMLKLDPEGNVLKTVCVDFDDVAETLTSDALETNLKILNDIQYLADAKVRKTKQALYSTFSEVFRYL